MKTYFIPVLLILSIILKTNTAFSQSPKPAEKDIVFLKKFRQDYITHLTSGTPVNLQRYYADTLRLMPPFQKTLIGKQSAIAYHQAFLDRFKILDFSRQEIEILDLGNQLMETGTLQLRLTLKSTSKEFQIQGKYLNLWQKRSEGDPLLLTEIWNYDQFYNDLHHHLKFESLPSAHDAMLPNVPITNSIRLELAAYNRLLDATVTQHDASTWSLYYSNDAILLTNYYPAFHGKKAINDYLQAHVKEMPTFEELDIRNHRIDDLGMYIVEYASHIASWKNGNSSGVGLGKNIRIWRRDPNHVLKLFRAIGNYD